MSNPKRASGWRVLGAVCLGHIAAALSFSSANMVGMVILDPSVPVTEPYRLVCEFAVIALGFPLMMLFIMLPFSFLTSPFVFMAAFSIRAGASTALTVGATIGAALTFWFAASSEAHSMTWMRAGFPGDRASVALIVADGAAAGMAYAWVVWSRCIRPYLDRKAVLRPSQA